MTLLLGRYRLEGELGRGAMGVVHRGYDEKLERPVALKELLLAPHLTPALRAEMSERFDREARAAGRLSHGSIVAVYDVLTEGERSFIVMEYLEGETLDRVLERGPLTPGAAAAITVQILAALAHAHANRVIHRDLKPENVFVLADGSVKVTDFGIAHVGDPSASLTRAGTILGTVGYMSPEQLRGEAIDERSDLFAIGVMLYEMLSGVNPFGVDAPTAVMYRIAFQEPQPLRKLRRGVPRYLEAIVRKALHKEREQRYGSAAEMEFDLLSENAPRVRPATLTAPGAVPMGALAPAPAARSAPTVIGEAPETPAPPPEQAPRSRSAPTVIGEASETPPTTPPEQAPRSRSAPTVIGAATLPQASTADAAAPAETGDALAADLGEPGARRLSKRTLLFAALITLAALVALAAIVAALPTQPKGDPTLPAPGQSELLAESQAVAAQDAALNKDAATYGKIVKDINKKAARNETALAAWDKTWQQRQARYHDEKAAVASYNANRPTTPSTTGTRTVSVWDRYSESYVDRTQTYTIPGSTAPPMSPPQPPSKPPKVQVRLEDERHRLAKLAKSLDMLAAQAAQTPAGPRLATAVALLREALTLLRQRVGDARTALDGVVKSKGAKGAAIDQKQIEGITVAGVADAVKAVRTALLPVLRSLDQGLPTTSSPSPAASSASPATAPAAPQSKPSAR